MGHFSWLTSDTKRSIPAKSSIRPTFPVYMISPEGRVFEEKNYEGFGVFGGKDIYALIAEINCPEQCTGDLEHDRMLGIMTVFKVSPVGDFVTAEQQGVIVPRLAEDKNLKFNELDPPAECADQGYFYEKEQDSYYD